MDADWQCKEAQGGVNLNSRSPYSCDWCGLVLLGEEASALIPPRPRPRHLGVRVGCLLTTCLPSSSPCTGAQLASHSRPLSVCLLDPRTVERLRFTVSPSLTSFRNGMPAGRACFSVFFHVLSLITLGVPWLMVICHCL